MPIWLIVILGVISIILSIVTIIFFVSGIFFFRIAEKKFQLEYENLQQERINLIHDVEEKYEKYQSEDSEEILKTWRCKKCNLEHTNIASFRVAECKLVQKGIVVDDRTSAAPCSK